MPRLTVWRVRVIKRAEAFEDIPARSGAEAEDEAAKRFGVVSVFPRSAIPTDLTAAETPPIGVRDE
jgi:hypothetical protein